MNRFNHYALVGSPKELKPHFQNVFDGLGHSGKYHFYDYALLVPDSADLVFYLAVTQDVAQVKRDLQSLRSVLPKTPIVFGMFEKSFDILLQAFYFNIKTVLLAPFEEIDIRQALIKSSILQEVADKVPTRELLQLFSRPIKNTNITSVHNRLDDYFNLFDRDRQFSIYSVSGDKCSLILGNEIDQNQRVVGQCQHLLQKKLKVGKFSIVKEDKFSMVYFPLLLEEASSVWGILKTSSGKEELIFNGHFLSYLEGISYNHQSLMKMDDLVKLANTDEITGLYNQRKLSEDLENNIKSHEKNHKKFSVMFIDVDHFKTVNDNWGHLVGSDMLCKLGSSIKTTLRESDYVYRYGGDEFVIIMPNVDRDTVHNIAIRVFNAIKNMEFEINSDTSHKLTVSIGIAEFPTDAKSAKDIIQFADEMMYQSKKSGRGKIFHIGEVKKSE